MQANSRLSDGYKLTDAQVRDFIVNGYLTVKTDLPRSVHETIYRKTQEYTEKEGNLGNNVLPRVPELQAIFEDPVVPWGVHKYFRRELRHAFASPSPSKPSTQ